MITAAEVDEGIDLRVRIDEVGGPLSGEVGNARRAWSERRGLLVTVEDAAGVWGQGEASPLPGYSPDGLAEARRDLEGWAASSSRLDAERPTVPELASPSARFAVETALLDLAARRRGVPLARLLGEPRRHVPLVALVTAESPEEAAEQASQAVARGIGTLKLKIGGGERFAADLRRAAAVRAAVGDDVGLRLDANGAWSVAEVEARLAEVAAFAPEMVEEPLASADLAGLHSSPLGGRLGRCGVPLALDESLARLAPSDTARLLDRGIFRAVVLKPTVLGGLSAALALAEIAAVRDAAVVVTHTFDGPVALAAAAALALVAPGVVACGLDRHVGLAVWPTVDLPMLNGGAIVAGAGPGLGIDRLEVGS